jgi:DNA-binding response OmpR family regulator
LPAARPRVLIIDDDLSICELLCTLFTDEGYDVRLAADGPHGLVLAREWRPDVVLLDVLMPGMNGRAFRAEQRRGGAAAIPVLVLTAASDPEAQAEALGAPLVRKPFDVELLLAHVRRLTSEHSPTPEEG